MSTFGQVSTKNLKSVVALDFVFVFGDWPEKVGEEGFDFELGHVKNLALDFFKIGVFWLSVDEFLQLLPRLGERLCVGKGIRNIG